MQNFNISRIFGSNSNSKTNVAKRRRKQRRTLRIEELEGREMLSATPWMVADSYEEPVSVASFIEVGMTFVPMQSASIGTPLTQAEFDSIRTQYADLKLSENMGDYNIIVIDASQLNEANLRAAITEAGETAKNDIMLLPCSITIFLIECLEFYPRILYCKLPIDTLLFGIALYHPRYYFLSQFVNRCKAASLHTLKRQCR